MRKGYTSWRRLGDVIGSLLFLGHHEQITSSVRVPPFVAEFRRTIFAWIYAADKNIAVYLGRPPRLTQQFCYFQIPRNALDSPYLTDAPPENESDQYDSTAWQEGWTRYTALRWSALCASVMEDIIALDRKRVRSPIELA